ncbi:guanosine monophosphate reductase [Patescibacteria group bacterium]|nr:MAG: guanosine monophosphate reductase [Patescibacteria group bacterium]
MVACGMGKVHTGKFLTFDDVLIRPAASSVEPREADVKTTIARLPAEGSAKAGGFSLDIPIVSAAMDKVTEVKMAVAIGKLGGLGIIHRSNTLEEEIRMVKEVKKKGVRVGAACSAFDLERAIALKKAGADLIAVDSAHGHNANVIAGAKKIKKAIGETPLLVGNIATAEAARELVKFADGIKVGIGPGSICTTRIVSGVGVPQLSAIMEVVEIAKKAGVPVIADGGMKNSGDIAKALGAGASVVMLGNLLAGTDVAPGKLVTIGGKKFKEYRGMGSMAVLKKGKANDRYLGTSKGIVPEGVSALVPYSGTLEEVIARLVGGIKVSMGYVGAKNLSDFQNNVQFMVVSGASVKENNPHSLAKVFED